MGVLRAENSLLGGAEGTMTSAQNAQADQEKSGDSDKDKAKECEGQNANSPQCIEQQLKAKEQELQKQADQEAMNRVQDRKNAGQDAPEGGEKGGQGNPASDTGSSANQSEATNEPEKSLVDQAKDKLAEYGTDQYLKQVDQAPEMNKAVQDAANEALAKNSEEPVTTRQDLTERLMKSGMTEEQATAKANEMVDKRIQGSLDDGINNPNQPQDVQDAIDRALNAYEKGETPAANDIAKMYEDAYREQANVLAKNAAKNSGTTVSNMADDIAFQETVPKLTNFDVQEAMKPEISQFAKSEVNSQFNKMAQSMSNTFNEMFGSSPSGASSAMPEASLGEAGSLSGAPEVTLGEASPLTSSPSSSPASSPASEPVIDLGSPGSLSEPQIVTDTTPALSDMATVQNSSPSVQPSSAPSTVESQPMVSSNSTPSSGTSSTGSGSELSSSPQPYEGPTNRGSPATVNNGTATWTAGNETYSMPADQVQNYRNWYDNYYRTYGQAPKMDQVPQQYQVTPSSSLTSYGCAGGMCTQYSTYSPSYSPSYSPTVQNYYSSPYFNALGR